MRPAKQQCEPATTIIRRLGGDTVVAGIAGVHRTRVSNWKRSREKGGTGGIIPHWHVAKLLAYAWQNNIELTEADFAPRVQIPEKVAS
jgi:hypothetical protein